MRVRVVRPCSCGLFWGQAYDEEEKCWKNVTLSCITRGDAERALRRYVREHRGKEEGYAEVYEL